MATNLLPLLVSCLCFLLVVVVVQGQNIGVNLGLLANNLPPPDKIVSLLQSRNIHKLRIFTPDIPTLEALRGSQIEVVVGTLNADLPRLDSDPSFADQWVQTNIIPYKDSVNFKYIAAGNEVIPFELAGHVLGAIKNLYDAVAKAGLSIPVSTAVSMTIFGPSYPPSQGVFSDAALPFMTPIVQFLASKNLPLLANVYTYFGYTSDPDHVPLDFALLTSTSVVIQDGPLAYTNLFDASIDVFYSALEKVGGSNVPVVVAETGWPSAAGGDVTTVDNAKTYNNNVVAKALKGEGTPKKPGVPLEVYLFALFDENQKPAGTEQHFGIYNPDMTEIYHVDFP